MAKPSFLNSAEFEIHSSPFYFANMMQTKEITPVFFTVLRGTLWLRKKKQGRENKKRRKSYKNSERICVYIYMKGSSYPIWIKWKPWVLHTNSVIPVLCFMKQNLYFYCGQGTHLLFFMLSYIGLFYVSTAMSILLSDECPVYVLFTFSRSVKKRKRTVTPRFTSITANFFSSSFLNWNTYNFRYVYKLTY